MMRVDDHPHDHESSSSSSVVVKPPGWLEGLMRETFFGSCTRHHHRRKNEKNIFCLHCCLSFCLHCLPSHPSSNHHPLLQVRRYVYHDVVRLEDLEKLIDCSYIQGYTINGAKVIFLNERAQSIRSTSITSSSSSSKGSSANFCLGCCRILQDPYLFCSLSCKVDYMVYQREDLSSIIYDHNNNNNNNITTFESQHDDHMAGSDVDPAQNHQYPTDHGPVNAADASISTTEIIHMNINNNPPKGKNKSKMIRRGFQLSAHDLPLMISNRRKGAPRRSPLS